MLSFEKQRTLACNDVNDIMMTNKLLSYCVIDSALLLGIGHRTSYDIHVKAGVPGCGSNPQHPVFSGFGVLKSWKNGCCCKKYSLTEKVEARS